MSPTRSPEAEAAREVFDAIIEAKSRGKVSQEAVNWAGSKAFEEFREEARAWAEADWEREKQANQERAKEARRRFWRKA